MTLEGKIKRVLDTYDDNKQKLKDEYNSRMDARSVNEFGETSADETLECNMWYIEQENKIRNEFVNAIMEIDKEVKR